MPGTAGNGEKKTSAIWDMIGDLKLLAARFFYYYFVDFNRLGQHEKAL